MTVAAALPLSTESFNRIMIRITENFDPVIRKKLHAVPSIYRNIQASGTFKLGEGYVRKVHTFHPGMDDQAGLLRWEAEEGYRAAGTNGQDDIGVDPCTYKAHMLGYGFKTETYSGWRTTRRSPNYCINDFIYEWQFEQQLAMILDSFGDTGMQIWENFGREMYMNFANKFVATSSLSPVNFTYDPFTSTQIVVPAGTQISTLTPKHLDAMHQMLGLQARDGALAIDSDMPVFGLVMHPYDWDDVIDRNEKLRDAYLQAAPDILIDGIGKVKKFRGYGMTFDLQAPRAKVVSQNAAGDLVLERVVPFKEEAVTQGSRWEPDREYLNAEYALVNIILKNVYEKQIPPTAPGRVGKASFGTTPSNDGELRWINIPDKETNILEEKGFFFSRFKAFAKPMENSEYAVTMLVKRCPQTPVVLCDPASDATAGAKTVSAAVAIDPEGTKSYYQVEVTLSDADGIACEAVSALTVTFVDASVATAIIADDSNAPTKYVITFATAADWVAYGDGIASVTCA